MGDLRQVEAYLELKIARLWVNLGGYLNLVCGTFQGYRTYRRGGGKILSHYCNKVMLEVPYTIMNSSIRFIDFN